MTRRRARWVGVATVAVLTVAGAVAVAPAAGASRPPGQGHNAHYVRIGGKPTLPRGAHGLSAVPASRTVHGTIALKPRDPARLTADASAVADPHNPQYRHYLAPHEFAARYGPSRATIASVDHVLRAAHLHVSSVSDNGMLVKFRGTAHQLEAAFHTRLQTYRANGVTGMHTTSAPALPAAVANDVTAVAGLNGSARPQPMYRRPTKTTRMSVPAKAAPHFPGEAKPCSTAVEVAQEENGLTMDQIAHAYGVDSLYKNGDFGQGTTIAIFELYPFLRNDVQTFDRCYFGKTKAASMIARLHNINVDGGSGTGYSPAGTIEADLDVEFAAALAPKATVNVYSGNPGNTQEGFIDTYNAIVSDDTAKVVSVSYGFCEQDGQTALPTGILNVENEIFEQAALQGQTVLASSGDSGADSCSPNGSAIPTQPYLSASDPSSQPFVMSVGGTTITNAVSGPAEHVWNGGAGGGAAGGGISSVWGAPSWQQSAFSSTDKTAVTHAYHDGAPKCQDALDGGMCRQLPDVSAEGDPNTGAPAEFDRNDGGWFDIGGTSVSAPLWAAMLDLINASSACKATRPLGFAPPTLYKAAAVASQYHANFSDVKAGNNDMFDLFNGRDFAAFAGYDMGSGLGSPHLGKLATNACAQAGANTAPAITSLSPNTETVGSEAPFTIHGTNLSTVTALSIGTYDLPSTAWTIVNDTAISVTNPPPASAQTGNVGPQDGSGRAIVNVSNANGAASPVTTSTVLTYLDGTSGSNVPSVSAASPAGGPLAGGNTTDVYGAGFTDTGPDAITSVTFGGVAASTFTVKSPTDLRVTVPAFSSGTTQCAAGNQPLTDICQAQVIVSNAHGPSATQPILKPDELDSGDCATGCEDYAGPTEYDYVPTPTITSMDLTYLSEFGDSVVTLTGTGFDPLALQWVNFGTAGPAVNQDPFIEYDSISSTQLTVDVIPHALTNAPKRVPVTVESLAGRSAPATAVYAGTPTLNDVSPHAGPTTGGTHIKFTGKNFQGSEPENGGAILYLVGFGGSEQLSGYTVSSDGKSITGTTPNAVAGDALVLVCTVTNCSFPETEKQFEATDFVFFEPGNPVVTALSQKAGPAHGGNTVTITGQNLDNVVAVKFGGHNSPRFSNGGLFASDMYHVTAVVPPGDAGKRVAVQVVTVESKHGGAPSKITSATHYTYRASSPSAPRDVKVKVHHTSVRVSWKKPLTDGGAALTGYRVIARPLPHQHGNAKPPKETAHSSKARSMTLKGLVPGWTYRILVRARNKHGLGLSGRAPKSYPIFAAR